jgi:hypothetical protein
LGRREAPNKHRRSHVNVGTAQPRAGAIAKIMQSEQTGLTMLECGGPRVYFYEELPRTVASAAGIKPILLPVPFAAWGALAWISELLPSPPITRNQVELMQIDSVSMPELPGLGALGIRPHSVEEIFQDILRNQ